MFTQGEGEALLGIYLDDNLNNLGFENVVIDNNLIYNGDSQGIRLENVNGASLINNTLLQSNDELNDNPGIVLKLNSQNIAMEDNILGHITIDEKDVTGIAPDLLDTISQNNNLIVQRE